jgi:hypothetical protein
VSVPLAVIEDIIDASGTAPQIQGLLPRAVRRRQLTARTLLTGMLLALADRRPACLTEIRNALIALPGPDQERLGVTADWHGRPHQLTYRQTEHTARLTAKTIGKPDPDGTPSDALQSFCDQLLEASIPAGHKNSSAALAADWTDVESWSRPPRHGDTQCADPEAHWGHRNSNLPGPKGEMFFGYYLSLAVMTREENGPPVPELARRMTLAGCGHDPVRQLAATLLRMAGAGIPLGDVIDDSGYAHRDASAWAIPLRNAGAQLVQDLHPHDRGPKGTHDGAIIANGCLYCPCTPRAAASRPAATWSPRRAGHRARPAGRRANPAQTQQAHQRRRRRLPPGHLPRDRREGPLPPPPAVDDTAPRPARDSHPARAPAGLLHPADHHRAPAGRGQDPAETRLPLRRLAELLRPAHQRRARQLHPQGHRQQ